MTMFVEISADRLPWIQGAQAPDTGAPGGDNVAFGRCGPGDRWRWLGDVYTPECRAHDAAVRGALANGSSQVGAHVRALPLLPSAIGSYVRERFR